MVAVVCLRENDGTGNKQQNKKSLWTATTNKFGSFIAQNVRPNRHIVGRGCACGLGAVLGGAARSSVLRSVVLLGAR